MKKFITNLLATVFFLFALTIKINAYKETWYPYDNRSITLFLSIEGNDLRIHSEKQFDNVGIQVVAPNGQTIYVNVINISAEAEMAIPLAYLPEGNYQVILTKNNQPVIWYLTK